MVSIGIDLGTTNSAAAYVGGTDAEIIEIDAERTMRSVVSFAPREGEDDPVVVGDGAVDYLETDKSKTVAAVKRHMGTRGPEGNPYTFEGEELEYTPEMISGLILKKIRQEVENEVRGADKVDGALITIPARFNEAARKATKAAAHYGYIDDVLMLLPEPSAACVAYKIDDDAKEIERAAVYDLGGGTFDLSIVDIIPDSDEPTSYVVQANEGKQQLGGEDFDEVLADWLIEQFEEETGLDTGDPAKKSSEEVYWRVKQYAKDAKERLSSADKYTVNIPFLMEGESLEQEVTIEKFEELTNHLVEETIDICERVFEEQGYGPEGIDTVLLVGGSTKMDQVQEAVEEYFGQEPVGGVNPDQAVALGAGEQAEKIGPRLKRGEDESEATDEDDEKSGLPGGGVTPVAPEDIGFELASGKMETIIEKNMKLPATVEEIGEYTTIRDNQTEAKIRVFKGDNDVAEENEHIKTFSLEDIEPAPAGEPDISVRFEMTLDGLVEAEAWDESVGAKAESELTVEPDTEGEGGGELKPDRYNPPSFEEIEKERDNLPDVR